ncbi:MAG TPA: T9SS type A sorting domain-containing protein, partial [Ignavibacteria bacterium]|nr:T9SS type A sorting domain-containing protein [Ignavibacteria bacterium]
NGRLDAIDDRLFAATIRNGNLYTAHNIGVINTGVASTTPNRDAARWYQINNLSSTPALVQSGTIFAGGTNDVNQRNYFFPTMMISGQGHIALGFSTAGTNEYANAGTTGRLNNDAAGYTQTPVLFTSSSTAYNPTGDPGTRGARRWGDYSVVSLDPEDDMTMWTAEQFCDTTNSYGVRIAKLAAPPPAALSSAVPDVLTGGLTSLSVVITGVSQSGSGFFDPGAGFTKRISASVSNGVIVNSVTYNSPTQVTLNLNTTNLSTTGSVITVSVTNPDGQSSSSSTILSAPLPVNLLAFNSSVQNGNDVLLRWSTSSEIDNSGFDIERKSSTSGWNKIAFIKGNGTTSTVSQYSFADRKLNSGKFSYRLRQIDYNGNFQYLNLSGDVNISLPPKFFISQNYPNPFNPLTKIDFAIPSDANVIIKLYDIRGREIKTIYTGSTTAGYYTVSLSSDDLSSGTYFYRIEALTRIQQFYEIKKLVILK